MLKKRKNAVAHLIGCVVLVIFTAYIGFFKMNDNNMNSNMKNIDIMVNQYKEIQKIDSDQLKVINKVKKIAHMYDTDLTETQLDSIGYLIYSLQFKYEHVNPDLICSHITAESGWKHKATSTAKAKGLMQIVNTTGVYLAIKEGYTDVVNIEDLLYDPIINVKLGVRYIAELNQEHGLEGGIVGYNSGPKYAYAYTKNSDSQSIPKETQAYLPRVLSLYNKYKEM